VSSLSEAKRRLRERSEHHLRLAVLRELGRDEPSTVKLYEPQGGTFWRVFFVPVYRRLPWGVKARAMNLMGMTAKGWQAPVRRPSEPWRPGAGLTPPSRSGAHPEPPPEA
jgi:hypothetical protein